MQDSFKTKPCKTIQIRSSDLQNDVVAASRSLVWGVFVCHIRFMVPTVVFSDHFKNQCTSDSVEYEIVQHLTQVIIAYNIVGYPAAGTYFNGLSQNSLIGTKRFIAVSRSGGSTWQDHQCHSQFLDCSQHRGHVFQEKLSSGCHHNPGIMHADILACIDDQIGQCARCALLQLKFGLHMGHGLNTDRSNGFCIMLKCCVWTKTLTPSDTSDSVS